MLAGIAARTSRIRLSSGVTVLSAEFVADTDEEAREVFRPGCRDLLAR
ncbi:hypothetical protein [Streptomyces sp. NPDC004065]